MAGVNNSHVYAEEWAIKLQEQLDEPNKFKEICRVEYTNSRVIHNPYLTDATVQTGLRGTNYTFQPVTETDDSVTINTFNILPQFIDRADLAQSTFLKQMEAAERQGILLNEAIETAVYAGHSSFTDFGTVSIGGGGAATDTITVSGTNIDDIVRAVRREVLEANGASLLQRNGLFFVWRPADFEYLEAFAQANGFTLSDEALRNGLTGGVNLMGATHYTSNLLATNHVMAGVKKAPYVGILKDTYGQIMVDEKDPTGISGISVVSRVDFKEKIWNKMVPVVFDVNVA